MVADLFTAAHGRGMPRSSDRLTLDDVLWVLCSRAAWRDVPERFGSWRRSSTASESAETAVHSIRCPDDCASYSMTKA
ncbi:transposase [Pseudomonas fulva]|uniref:transposase n=1 Tax=Pseudomonas fulva TaxID=47880 RepID=UPI003D021885